MSHETRLVALRRVLAAGKFDAAVISNLTNARYLCGFTGSAGMCVVTSDAAHFLTDFRYKAQTAQQVSSLYQTHIIEGVLWKAAGEILKKLGAPRTAFEAEHVSYAAYHDTQDAIKPVHLMPSRRLVEDLRLHKDAAEIAIIERAVKIIDDCFAHLCDFIKIGQTELEVADEVTRFVKSRGASGVSFETIVASGERSALPHGVAGTRVLARGDMITIDMGAVLDGYCSDFTRTLCLGAPTQRQQEIYETVWRAQTAACGALKPGLGCKEADAVARKIIEDAGFAENFGHGLGHGVGMEIHEAPRLSKLGTGKLQPGMVVTCEPGIYVEGLGGVRIEDMLLITESGARILTGADKPRELLQVG